MIKETKFTSGSESDGSSHGLILKKLEDLENKLKSDINEILEKIGDLKKGTDITFYFRAGRQGFGHNFLCPFLCPIRNFDMELNQNFGLYFSDAGQFR